MITTHALRGAAPRTLLAVAVLIAILGTGVAAVVGYAAGVRWFEVETPSMGSVAPVGTLVVTVPVSADEVRVGDVLAFRPPSEPGSVYTHRVLSIGAGGIETRGDINGAADAWRLQQRDLVGTAVLLLPGAGFLLRAVPMLLAGNAVVWIATRRMRSRAQRAALRNVGFSLVAALPAFVLHPFVQMRVLATEAAGRDISASVVSTGLLPIRVSAEGAQSISLRDGQVGVMTLPPSTDGYHLTSNLDLHPQEWVLLVAICLLPLVWNLVAGLPNDGEEAAQHDDRQHPSGIDAGRARTGSTR